MQQKPWAAGQEGSWCYFEPLSQTEGHPGKVPYCSVLLRMACLNSRKWSGFHLKKAVSICHKSSQPCSTTQKWQIYPWMHWNNFFHFSDVSLLVCFRCVTVAHLSLCRWHPQGVSGFPPKWRTRLWQSGAAGGAATSQAACTETGQNISAAMESCDTVECIRQSLIFHLVQRLSHTCLKVTGVPLHLMLLIRRESWGILLWLITLSIPLSLFFPSIFNFMFCLPAALAH